ncbi:MAG TPA: hypothetical protein VLA28_02030 [Afifellaceae bacterium]|nr:hypothetical protein [Afifellaceae bacterium]
MRDSPWYIAFLIVLVGGVMGYIYFSSEVRVVQVTGKRVEEGRSRYGMSSEVYVIETNRGGMPILKFPIIGYAFGAREVYDGIRTGSSIRVRVGKWPPAPISKNARSHVMAVY